MSAPAPADAAKWTAYSFAVLYVVPHPHLGTAVPIGVILHARTAQYMGMRVLADPAALAARAPGVDVELLCRYLDGLRAVAEGDAAAGPVALLPTSERFHWLTAPRSDVLQAGRVHGGFCLQPAEELERLFSAYVQ